MLSGRFRFCFAIHRFKMKKTTTNANCCSHQDYSLYLTITRRCYSPITSSPPTISRSRTKFRPVFLSSADSHGRPVGPFSPIGFALRVHVRKQCRRRNAGIPAAPHKPDRNSGRVGRIGRRGRWRPTRRSLHCDERERNALRGRQVAAP